MKFFLFLSLLGVALAGPGQPGTYIIQGKPVPITEALYQVSIQTLRGNHLCAGTIIDPQWVLTTAQCALSLNTKLHQIRYNTESHNFGGQTMNISRIEPHREYSAQTTDNNIALIGLKNRLSSAFSCANYPCRDTLRAGELLNVTGWGWQTEESGVLAPNLQQVTLPYSDLDCAPYYAGLGFTIRKTNFCGGYVNFGGPGICTGDEGGPAMRKSSKTIQGIASFSHGCGKKGYVSVFTRISSYSSWIHGITGKACLNEY